MTNINARPGFIAAAIVTVILVAYALAGCGGNNDDDSRADIGPPDCVNHPDLCK